MGQQWPIKIHRVKCLLSLLVNVPRVSVGLFKHLTLFFGKEG